MDFHGLMTQRYWRSRRHGTEQDHRTVSNYTVNPFRPVQEKKIIYRRQVTSRRNCPVLPAEKNCLSLPSSPTVKTCPYGPRVPPSKPSPWRPVSLFPPLVTVKNNGSTCCSRQECQETASIWYMSATDNIEKNICLVRLVGLSKINRVYDEVQFSKFKIGLFW